MEWLKEYAAVIQAIGTLLAIAIAIWVPFKIHSNETRRREHENRLKGQAIALLIEPLLRVIDGQIEREGILRPEGPRQFEIPELLLSLSRPAGCDSPGSSSAAIIACGSFAKSSCSACLSRADRSPAAGW